MVCACLCGCAALRGKEPCVWPGEDVSVCGAGAGMVVFAGDVEAEVEEGLGVDGEKGGVAGENFQ